jgi:hypothetical protein
VYTCSSPSTSRRVHVTLGGRCGVDDELIPLTTVFTLSSPTRLC